MRFKIGCRLAYQTEPPVTFVFNIEAQRFPLMLRRRRPGPAEFQA